jgi:hypothetical protein
MPDLKLRLVQKDENDKDQIVAEGTYDQVKILQKGELEEERETSDEDILFL